MTSELDASDEAYRPIEDVWGHFDVRRIVVALCDGTIGLHDVVWSEMRHGYGHAGTFPELFGRIVGGDAGVAAAALDDVWNLGFVEGVATVPGALIAPFLLRAATDPTVHRRHELLKFVANVARREMWFHESRTDLLHVTYPEVTYDVTGYVATWSIDAARHAVGAHVTSLISLLDNPDPRIRRHAAYALAAAAPASDSIIRALDARLSSETDMTVQIGLVLAVAQHSRELAVVESALTWTRALWSDPNGAAAVRLAGAIAWLCLTTAPPPPPLVETVTEMITPAVYDALHGVPWVSHLQPDQLPTWIAVLLHDPASGSPPPKLWPPMVDDPWADLSNGTSSLAATEDAR